MHITPIHTHMDEQKLDPGKMSSEKVKNSKKKVKIMQHNKNQELKLLRQLTSNPGKYNNNKIPADSMVTLKMV